ncbi:galectin-1-like [Phascolarctos cinereus]|uniref:Galectin n=1 Tax=Phascolarctos cinereus TaxID=38626 RepID=A0A6P5JYS3_PHACI|nr:galectin-1-like [Phascolarctos cinereus]
MARGSFLFSFSNIFYPDLSSSGKGEPFHASSPLQIVFDKLQMFAHDMNLKPGAFLRIVGDILPDARHFAIDLGDTYDNLALHFNPRFNYRNCHNVVIYNTLYNEYFGKEIRDSYFPFQKGTRMEICIQLQETFFVVKLPDGYQFSFPNRTKITTIDYVGIHGDLTIRAIAFE